MDTGLQNQKAIEISPWERAHKTLDTIGDEMRARLGDIEHAQSRLAGGADAIRGVLNRIQASPPQQPIASYTPVNPLGQRY